jgi:hypothetical protein
MTHRQTPLMRARAYVGVQRPAEHLIKPAAERKIRLTPIFLLLSLLLSWQFAAHDMLSLRIVPYFVFSFVQFFLIIVASRWTSNQRFSRTSSESLDKKTLSDSYDWFPSLHRRFCIRLRLRGKQWSIRAYTRTFMPEIIFLEVLSGWIKRNRCGPRVNLRVAVRGICGITKLNANLTV